ncbi:MAG TPA: L,D-transpeptidase family protein [Solirubrobacterales bacterium]|nr:L,D-transpeptidase family protein [Solirubrobacterales bacterium]
MQRRAVAALVGVCCAALTVTCPAAGGARPEHLLRLSDELAFSRSAHAFRDAAVRRRPSPGAPIVTHLHRVTEDGFAETYLLLAELDARHADDWVRLRVPGRPNGRTGWVRRSALGPYHPTRVAVLIDKRTLRLTFLVDGHPRWSAPVGIGAPATPTPSGRFWVREQFPVEGDPFYGPYAFGTSAYARLTDWPGGGVVGIHGTDEPGLIPGRPSHGCIRLRNRDIRRLARLLPNGAPVEIR